MSRCPAGGVLLPLLVLLATILTRCNASTVRELVDRHQPLALPMACLLVACVLA